MNFQALSQVKRNTAQEQTEVKVQKVPTEQFIILLLCWAHDKRFEGKSCDLWEFRQMWKWAKAETKNWIKFLSQSDLSIFLCCWNEIPSTSAQNFLETKTWTTFKHLKMQTLERLSVTLCSSCHSGLHQQKKSFNLDEIKVYHWH